MIRKNQPEPPSHLRPATRAWWLQVIEEYDLQAHHIRLLTLAAESWDRCVAAREAIETHGMIFVDRFDQPRTRPEVSIERDSRISFSRLLRELALDVSEPSEPSPPPTIRGNAALKKG